MTKSFRLANNSKKLVFDMTPIPNMLSESGLGQWFVVKI